jgi:hypothetical protein
MICARKIKFEGAEASAVKRGRCSHRFSELGVLVSGASLLKRVRGIVCTFSIEI